MIVRQDKDLVSHYVGIDISKDKSDVCIMDLSGKVVSTFQMTSGHQGFQSLEKQIPKTSTPVFVMESTGAHSGNLFHHLKGKGHKCILANPFEVSRLRDAFSKSVKNDIIDAFVLGQAARMDVVKHSTKEVEYIYLQDILERFYDVVERRTSLLNQLRSSLVETFPEITKVFWKMTGLCVSVILSKYQSASVFAEADLVEMKSEINGKGGRISMKKLEKLQELSKQSVAWKQTKFHRQIILSQIREMKRLKREVEFLEKLLDTFVTRAFPKELQLLQSVPGIRKITAMQSIAIIGDHRRFDKNKDGKGSKRLSSFVGLGMREYSSGMRSLKMGISKRGNAKLRGQLFMASFSVVRQDKSIADYFHKKKQQGGGKKALVAVSHLLLRRAYGVLKTGKQYNAAIPAAG